MKETHQDQNNSKQELTPTGLPFGMSWNGFYTIVVVWLVVQIILFYLITILLA
ncbi:MAG: hypothetical protein WD077_15810 [Bacteroidia bacterium]